MRRPARYALVLMLATGAPALAQVTTDTTRGPARAAQGVARREVPDSLRPPLSPGRAFLYSFLLPGLGQARLERHMAGTLYFGVEALSIAMLAKSSNDVRVAKAQQEYAVVGGYQLDANGAPIRDQNGAFVAADSVRSRYSTERVRARQTHVEDWIAILIFNHLFAGIDALVSSLLWDVPARVGLRARPSGVGIGVTVHW
ncbi:MAG TPA: hypothetical protein VLE53_02280 [Gemmatimonadaceae bacterium]|nr:hypothetical protein [Gemmatimonadaceae bacterium]